MSYAMASRSPRRARKVARNLLMLPLLVFLAVSGLAATYVAYVLWPRWPGPAVTPNAPTLPIVVGGTAFNVPPAAIRRQVQRKPGTQDRIDLIFIWPTLAPPASAAEAGPQHGASANPETARPLERIFLTVAAGDGGPSALERMQTIYRRYLAPETLPAPDGLIMLAFKKDTPYQGEDLLYTPDMVERFLLRCTRDGNGLTPGMCLHERRIGGADVTARFPRAWLSDWPAVADGIDRLISRLQQHASIGGNDLETAP
jgi:hypothetical protein